MKQPRLSRLLVTLALSVGAGCWEFTGPTFPTNAQPFSPLPPYATWWRLVEDCVGQTGSFSSIEWFRTPDEPGLVVDGKPYVGYWFSEGNRIVLRHNASFDGGTVRHEMLHALLHSGNHPREYFVDRCDALTPCEQCGLTEASRGVPSTAREVPPEALDVSAHVEPSDPTVAVDSGWIRLIVNATNPSDDPVWVLLADDVTFFYVEAHSPGTYHSTTAPRWAFRPHETRRYIFDVQYAAGTYTFYTAFSTKRAPPLTVLVRP